MQQPRKQMLPTPIRRRTTKPRLKRPTNPTNYLQPRRLITKSQNQQIPRKHSRLSLRAHGPTQQTTDTKQIVQQQRPMLRQKSTNTQVPTKSTPNNIHQSKHQTTSDQKSTQNIDKTNPPLRQPKSTQAQRNLPIQTHKAQPQSKWVKHPVTRPHKARKRPNRITMQTHTNQLRRPMLRRPQSTPHHIPMQQQPRLLMQGHSTTHCDPTFTTQRTLRLPKQKAKSRRLPLHGRQTIPKHKVTRLLPTNNQ